MKTANEAKRVLQMFVEAYNLQQLFADFLGGSDFLVLYPDDFERAFQRGYFAERILEADTEV